MIRFAILILALLNGTAMARDNSLSDTKVNTPAQDVISSENVSDQWRRSPQGQYSAELAARMSRGEITLDDRIRLFRERFPDAPPPPMYANPRRPAPRTLLDFGSAPTQPMPPMLSFE